MPRVRPLEQDGDKNRASLFSNRLGGQEAACGAEKKLALFGLGGCYVAALFPLPAGATDFTLWITDGNIKGHGSVQTCHPGVGMGIKFIDLTYQATRRLDDYLRASVSVPPAEAPQLYLR